MTLAKLPGGGPWSIGAGLELLRSEWIVCNVFCDMDCQKLKLNGTFLVYWVRVCYTIQQLVYSSALLMFWVSAFKSIFYRVKDCVWGQTYLWMSWVLAIVEKTYWASQAALLPFLYCNSGCKFAKDVLGRKKPKLCWHGNCQDSHTSLCPRLCTTIKLW